VSSSDASSELRAGGLVRRRIELQAARQKHTDDWRAGESLREKLLCNLEVFAAVEDVVEYHYLAAYSGTDEGLVDASDGEKLLEALPFRGLVVSRGAAGLGQ
jgi:hypothetical protein